MSQSKGTLAQLPPRNKVALKKRRRSSIESEAAQPSHDEGNWLVSYADMMTLLCGFFIMIFSLSKIDEQKYEKVKQEVAKTFRGEYHAPSTVELADKTKELLKNLGVDHITEVRNEALSVNIVFQSTLFFETLSADVRTEGNEVLEKVIAGLLVEQEKSNKQYKIIVEGHTDSRPILPGTKTPFPTNWELSGARAAKVVRIFIEKGFKPVQLSSVGLADTQPEYASRNPAGEWDEDALAKNRRVVLKITEAAQENTSKVESPSP